MWKVRAWKTQLESPNLGEVEGGHRMLPYLQAYKKKKNGQKSEESENPQHTNNMEWSPSKLDFWELADPKESSEALFAQTRSKPMDYKERILSVR